MTRRGNGLAVRGVVKPATAIVAQGVLRGAVRREATAHIALGRSHTCDEVLRQVLSARCAAVH